MIHIINTFLGPTPDPTFNTLVQERKNLAVPNILAKCSISEPRRLRIPKSTSKSLNNNIRNYGRQENSERNKTRCQVMIKDVIKSGKFQCENSERFIYDENLILGSSSIMDASTNKRSRV